MLGIVIITVVITLIIVYLINSVNNFTFTMAKTSKSLTTIIAEDLCDNHNSLALSLSIRLKKDIYLYTTDNLSKLQLTPHVTVVSNSLYNNWTLNYEKSTINGEAYFMSKTLVRALESKFDDARLRRDGYMQVQPDAWKPYIEVMGSDIVLPYRAVNKEWPLPPPNVNKTEQRQDKISAILKSLK